MSAEPKQPVSASKHNATNQQSVTGGAQQIRRVRTETVAAIATGLGGFAAAGLVIYVLLGDAHHVIRGLALAGSVAGLAMAGIISLAVWVVRSTDHRAAVQEQTIQAIADQAARDRHETAQQLAAELAHLRTVLEDLVDVRRHMSVTVDTALTVHTERTERMVQEALAEVRQLMDRDGADAKISALAEGIAAGTVELPDSAAFRLGREVERRAQGRVNGSATVPPWGHQNA